MTLHLNPQTEAAIKAIAARRKVSVEHLLDEYVQKEQVYHVQRQADLEALDSIHQGQGIDHQDMVLYINKLRQKALQKL